MWRVLFILRSRFFLEFNQINAGGIHFIKVVEKVSYRLWHLRYGFDSHCFLASAHSQTVGAFFFCLKIKIKKKMDGTCAIIEEINREIVGKI